MASNFAEDAELSQIINKLWELDDNKCFPDVDYEIDLQGSVYSTRDVSEDHAKNSLFKWVNEDKVFSRPTYKAFRALLDNYEMELGQEEVVTREELKENQDFLNAILATKVMKEAHKYLVSKRVAPEDKQQFKAMLNDIWFKMFRRQASRGADSCSFEHVFVGEGRDTEMIGLHNWIQFYLQEKAGNINYNGHFRKETVKDDSVIRLLAVQFTWKGIKAKPFCSVFIGSSPEFEVAAYTICLLLDRDGKADIKIGEYEVELTVHSFGRQRKLGTAYIAAARMETYAKKRNW
ncbi:poly(U)-specific endoribonuclease-A [Biomphalaria glabrata]|uniref:Uridylate-specific endoribonuclease n=1 Tax=Biomphalaria glabrata TaxID=6526 RepID=A0A2C9JRI3_BIOGL|nr:poly(U)-specific endoribonuclease-A-like [Biomphalaria glabrata]KAI8749806.1 poly(U)-specific endoribonuclease-A-like [Biomphalaria glabrata]